MNYHNLLKQISDYVLSYYKAHADERLVYHDKQHTENMVSRAMEIANHYQLNDHDYFTVIAAAWFHDTGYMVDTAHHEAEGAIIAETYLKSVELPEEDIAAIKTTIMATKMPQTPTNLLEQIICDADLYHLGTDDFLDTDKLLRRENNTLHGTDVSKPEWRKKSIVFLESHHYHTDYAQVLLNGTKQKNVIDLKNRVAEDDKKEAKKNGGRKVEAIVPNEGGKPVMVSSKNDKDKDKDREEPKKGIETMFRISSANHQRLSDMADNKAHIMITVNSIILSAIISLVLRRLSDNEYLIIPTFILLAISLLAITFSILATRPSIPEGTFTRADVDEHKVNLLFFGNFYKMPLEEYTYGMQMMMDDKDFLYGSLIKDVYAQGVVLGKKYRLLRIAYNIFMFGLIVSVLAFIISSAFFAGKPII